MKKYLLIVFLVLIIPSITFAVWWNPLSWSIFSFLHKKEIPQLVEQVQLPQQSSDESVERIAALQQEIELLKIKNSESSTQESTPSKTTSIVPASTPKPTPISSEPVPTPQPVITPPPVQTNTSTSLQKITVAEYVKNPKAYFDKPIRVMSGRVVAFNQGSTNFIQVIDNKDFSSHPESIQFQILSDADYTKIVESLSLYDSVLINGHGQSNVRFNVIGDGGSYESYEPSIILDSIYLCKSADTCKETYNLGVHLIFEKK